MAYEKNEKNLGVALDWDAEITSEGDAFVLLKPGVYEFTVTGIERKEFPGSKNMAACHQVTVTLDVDGATVRDNFYMNSKSVWRIAQIFRAVGIKKKGQPFRPNWDQLPGMSGRVRIKNRSYTGNDGNEYNANDVDSYLEPGAAAGTSQSQSAAGAAKSWTSGKF